MADVDHRYYKEWSELNDKQRERSGSRAEHSAAREAAGLKGVSGGYEAYQQRMAGDAIVEEATGKPAAPQVENINNYDNTAYGAGSGKGGDRFSAADIRNLDQQGFSYDEIKQYADKSVAGGTKMGGKADAVLAEIAARQQGPANPAPATPAQPATPATPAPSNPAPSYPAPSNPGPSNPAPAYPVPSQPPPYNPPYNPTPAPAPPTVNPVPSNPTNPTPVPVPSPVVNPTVPPIFDPGPTTPVVNNDQDQDVNTDQDVDQTIDQEVNNRNDVDNSSEMTNNSVNTITGDNNWINNAMYHFGGNTTINNWSELVGNNNNSQKVNASQGFGGWGAAGPDGTTAGVQSDLDDWANAQGFGWSNDMNDDLMSKKAMGHSGDFDSPADGAKFVQQWSTINDMAQDSRPQRNHAAISNERINNYGIDTAAMHQFSMLGSQNARDRATILGGHIFGDMWKYQAPDWNSSIDKQPAPNDPDIEGIADDTKDDIDDIL